ncbi:hypothetical protein DFS34DRAFT_693102 [Phlyctochytrium arcticum]|nr:hypothetical protein DFS34DRAFT_693102 [Phlyctochytrium arcticum]
MPKPTRFLLIVSTWLFSICIFMLNFDVVIATEACHPESHAVEEIYKLDLSVTTNITRVNCYFDTVFYYNAALLARPKAEYAWLDPWVRQYWAHVRRMFGSCSVDRVNDPLYGRQCENYGAPKPLFVFASRIGATAYESSYGYPRFWYPFRNYLKIEARTFSNVALIKEMLAHNMVDVHQMGPHGTGSYHFHNVWARYGGFSHFPLYDFYYQTGETAAATAYYNRWFGWNSGDGLAPDVDWFGFFYTLWTQSGKNLHFMRRFFDYWSSYFPMQLADWETIEGRVVRGWEPTRDMDLGELTHFLSAAIGRNISAYCATTFGSATTPKKYRDAIARFPQMTYIS